MQLNNIHHEAAIRMLNEIHERMGYELVYKLKLEMLAVDKIAEKHIAKAFAEGMKAVPAQAQERGAAMTQDEIKALAKQAGGTPYVNRQFPGKLAVAFSGQALIDFVALVQSQPVVKESLTTQERKPLTVTELIEAANSASVAGFITGTSNWASAMVAALAKEQP